MVAENVVSKKKISIANYGGMISDCGLSATKIAVANFFLGIIGISVSLKYLNKFVPTNNEAKACACIFGAVGLAVYSAKKVRQDCERKIHDEYEI